MTSPMSRSVAEKLAMTVPGGAERETVVWAV